MKAMILAAGRGTRLLPLTESMPKPMIPINSEPMIVHQIRWLKRAGIREVVVNVHHLGEQIEACLGSGKHLGVHVTFSRESRLLETGGGIMRALEFLGDHPFIVLNGDVWTNFPFKSLASKSTEYAHLILKPADAELGDFELVDSAVRWHSDPIRHTHTFCGISLLHPRIFARPLPEVFSITRDLIFELAQQDKITGESFDGHWIDIGSPSGLKSARRLTM